MNEPARREEEMNEPARREEEMNEPARREEEMNEPARACRKGKEVARSRKGKGKDRQYKLRRYKVRSPGGTFLWGEDYVEKK